MALPDAPTIAEAGVPGYDAAVIIGIMAPTGTPRSIVERLNAEINTIMKRPDVREAWQKVDSQILVSTPEDEASYRALGRGLRTCSLSFRDRVGGELISLRSDPNHGA